MYKIKHGLSPPVLNQFVNVAANGYRLTRSALRGDYMVPLRKVYLVKECFQLVVFVSGVPSHLTLQILILMPLLSFT